MIIGLGHKQQVGKDTIADYLVKNNGFVKMAFADALKDLAKKLGWDGKKDRRGRQFLQRLGTDCIRDYSPDYWISRLFANIDGLLLPPDIIVPDVRFVNEAEAIRERKGVVIKVVRTTGITDTHKSEQALNKYSFDYTIDNNGSFSQLYEKVDRIVRLIKK